jgi:hypothetical protein
MEVKVPFSRPRDPETLIFSQEFQKMKQKIVLIIKEESKKSMAEVRP